MHFYVRTKNESYSRALNMGKSSFLLKLNKKSISTKNVQIVPCTSTTENFQKRIFSYFTQNT